MGIRLLTNICLLVLPIIQRLQDNFERACVVVVDTTVARKALVEQKNIFWMTYYQLEYDVILHFGNTEFKAQIAWKEDVSF